MGPPRAGVRQAGASALGANPVISSHPIALQSSTATGNRLIAPKAKKVHQPITLLRKVVNISELHRHSWAGAQRQLPIAP